MIIVNFATKEYSRGQKRLSDSIPSSYNKLMFSQYDTIGSPTHQESPYEFKIHAIRKAAEIDPVVLWVDASMYCVGDLSKIEKIILENGYFMEEAGHWVGSWCNDHTKKFFNLQPDEYKVPGGYNMFSAGLLGLNFIKDRKNNPGKWLVDKHEIVKTFFDAWALSAKEGCFKGSWNDHRHDMTCGSIIASRLGMKYQRGGSHMAYIGPGYSQPEPGVVFHLQGVL